MVAVTTTVKTSSLKAVPVVIIMAVGTGKIKDSSMDMTNIPIIPFVIMKFSENSVIDSSILPLYLSSKFVYIYGRNMDSKLINDILAKSMSQDHVIIINKLSEPKRDEEIATELNMKETTIRTLLNDLHAEGLVEYERTKNKKTGWYTYTWKKRNDKVQDYVKDQLNIELNKLVGELDQEENGTTLACSCSRISLNDAMEMNFICPECNETFYTQENSNNAKEIKDKIAHIEGLLQVESTIIVERTM